MLEAFIIATWIVVAAIIVIGLWHSGYKCGLWHGVFQEHLDRFDIEFGYTKPTPERLRHYRAVVEKYPA